MRTRPTPCSDTDGFSDDLLSFFLNWVLAAREPRDFHEECSLPGPRFPSRQIHQATAAATASEKEMSGGAIATNQTKVASAAMAAKTAPHIADRDTPLVTSATKC